MFLPPLMSTVDSAGDIAPFPQMKAKHVITRTRYVALQSEEVRQCLPSYNKSKMSMLGSKKDSSLHNSNTQLQQTTEISRIFI